MKKPTRRLAATAALAFAAALSAPTAAQAALITGTYTFGTSGFVNSGAGSSFQGTLTVTLRDDAQGLAGFAPGSSFALPLNPLDALEAFEASYSGAGSFVPAAHFELNEVTDIVIADEGTFSRNPPSLAAVPRRFTVFAVDADTGARVTFFLVGPGGTDIRVSTNNNVVISRQGFAVLGTEPPPDVGGDDSGSGGQVPVPGTLVLALAAGLLLPIARRRRNQGVNA